MSLEELIASSPNPTAITLVLNESDGFGFILDFAEMLGFKDDGNEQLTPQQADALEEEALAYITQQNIRMAQKSEDQWVWVN